MTPRSKSLPFVARAAMLAAAAVFASGCTQTASVAGARQSSTTARILPSWNDTTARQSIVEFVERVTRPGADFVPEAERIAVFDNDGTLWAEQPMYFQLLFALDRIRALAPSRPDWRTKEPYASVIAGKVTTSVIGDDEAMLAIMEATHDSVTVEEYERSVREWFDTARHPGTGRRYTEMVYQPMLEVLGYLRANGFKTFIVSGGGVGFMRVFAERVYGIPPEQVVGSTSKVTFQMEGDRPVLRKLPRITFLDDKAAKPVSIYQNIGRRPIAAFGNSDGDLQMLQWTCDDLGPQLCVYVHHTDGQREWAYDRASAVGRLDKGLDEARRAGWTLVDMKRDWKVVFDESR